MPGGSGIDVHDNHGAAGRRRWEAPDVLFEVGRQVQAVALAMRKHTFAPGLRICTCGRVVDRPLPGFGLRCEVASEQWLRAEYGMRRVLQEFQVHGTRWSIAASHAVVGRAPVRPAVEGGGSRQMAPGASTHDYAS